jgi:hypothetical protein
MQARNVFQTLNLFQQLSRERNSSLIESYSDNETGLHQNLKKLHSKKIQDLIGNRYKDQYGQFNRDLETKRAKRRNRRGPHQQSGVTNAVHEQIIQLHDDLLRNIVKLKYDDAETDPKGSLKQARNLFGQVAGLGSWFLYFDSLITARISKEDLKTELKKRVPHEGYQSQGVLLNGRDPQLWKKILNGLTSTEIIDLFKDKPTNALLVPIKERYFGIIPLLLGRLGDLYNPKTHAKCIIDLMTNINTNADPDPQLLRSYIETATPADLKTSLENNDLAELIKNPQKFIEQKATFKKLHALEQLIQYDLPDLKDYHFTNDFDNKFKKKLDSLITRLLQPEAETDTDHLRTLKKFYQNYELSPDIISLMQEPLKTFEKMNLLNILKNRLSPLKQDNDLKALVLDFAQKLLEYKPTSSSGIPNTRSIEVHYHYKEMWVSGIPNTRSIEDFIQNAEPEILETSLKTGQIKSLFTMDYHSYSSKKERENKYHRLIELLEHKGDLDNLETTTTYNFLDESTIQKQKEKILELLQSSEDPKDSTTLKVFRQIMKANILTSGEIITKYLEYPRLKEVIKVLDQFLKDLKGFDTSSSESQELISEFIKRANSNSQEIMTDKQKEAASRFLQSNSSVEFANLIRQLKTGSPPYSNLFQETQYVLSMLNIAKKTLEKTSNIGLDFDPEADIAEIDSLATIINNKVSKLSTEKHESRELRLTKDLDLTKSKMTELLKKYNESINLYNFDPQNEQQDLMIFPEERKSLSEAARAAAIGVADSGFQDSASFWNLAQAARTYRQNPLANAKTNAPTDFRLRLESTIKQQEESLLLEMFKWCANDIEIFNTSKPNQYPGPGFVVKGINIARALGIENENPKEHIRSLERDILPHYTKDGTVGKYDGIFSNMEKSELYFTRGFIAIVPPGYEHTVSTFHIPTDAYPQPGTGTSRATRSNRPLPDSLTQEQIDEKIINRHREHYSYIVFNDHFGREQSENKIEERAYLVPTTVLKELTHPYLRKYFDSTNSFDKESADFSQANITLSEFRRLAEKKGFNILNLTAPTNYGSLANAFPVRKPPYHTWENHRQNETKDKDAGHVHNTQMLGGYTNNPFYLMEHFWSLQEAEQIVDNVATGTQAIFDVFKIMRSYYTRGLSKHDPCVMLNEAQKIHNNLKANEVTDRNQYPILCVSDLHSRFDLSRLPELNLYLDTFDMTIYDKRKDENNNKQELAYSLTSKLGLREQEIFKDLFIEPNNYLHQHLLFYPRHLFEKYSSAMLPKFDDGSYLSLINKYIDQGLIN